MKVVDNRKSVEINFGEIKNGEIFEHCGIFYLKIIEASGYRAVNIENGVLDGSFTDMSVVIPIKATLIINRLD